MNTPYYQKYFEWYTPLVTKEEIVNIYNKLNMTFTDLVPLNEGKKRKLSK